jgi:uncharacterized protein (DUF1330 family)
MQRLRFELVLGVVFLGLFVAVVAWLTPSLWHARMTAAEVDHYVAEMDAHLALPTAEKADFIARVRAWATADDGEPVLMLNLMRYYDTLQSLPAPLEFNGTPAQANAMYEAVVAPLALRRGEYPLLAGSVQGGNLVGYEPALDHWDHVVIMRAPSRRAFVEFMADPEYGAVAAYKTVAAKVLLIPVTPELAIPDLRYAVGSTLFALYFFICWVRRVRASRDR